MTENYPAHLQNTCQDLVEKAAELEPRSRKEFVKQSLEDHFRTAAAGVQFLELTPDEQALLIDYKLWKEFDSNSVSGVFHWKKRKVEN
jgi:uncharacterized protein (DUF1778 family)